MAASEQEKAAQEAAWWAEWRALDFSWPGLQKKSAGWGDAEGSTGARGEYRLQDYWRWDPGSPDDAPRFRNDEEMLAAGELVKSPDGAYWHLAHVPMTWADGSPAKSAWTTTQRIRLSAILRLRIDKSIHTEVDYRTGWSRGKDGRAQLRGVVLGADCWTLPRTSDMAPLLAVLHHAWLENFFATRAVIGAGTTFRFAYFKDNTTFYNAVFRGIAYFHRATFSGNTDFSFASFFAGAFVGSIFLGDARFYGALFLDTADFQDAEFRGRLSFGGASFEGAAVFFRIKWPERPHHWHSAFNAARFKDFVSFRGSGFKAFAAFDGAQFYRPLQFDAPVGTSKYSDPERAATAVFWHELKEAAKGEAEEWAEAERQKVRAAYDQLLQQRAEAKTKVGEGGYSAPSDDLPLTEQSKGVIPDALHHPLVADDAVLVIDPKWRRGDMDTVFAQHHAMPQRARDDTKVEALRPRKRHPWFVTGFLGMLADWQEDQGYKSKLAAIDAQIPAKRREFKTIRARQIERGCRVLKQEMAKQTNKTREHLLFKFELLARRGQLGLISGERYASYAYEWVADFGAAILRPVLATVLLMIVFAGSFWCLGVSVGYRAPVATALWEAADLSLSSTFRPFQAVEDQAGKELGTQQGLTDNQSCLDSEDESPSLAYCLQNHSPGLRFGVRTLAVVQSLFAIVFLFLFALAVRRRFQIS